jgi:hypothetical protein
VPGMTVVGTFPSAGVEAEVARGQFLLPDGLSLQFPTGRFIDSDGEIWLEGKGVQPTLFVPVTRETVFAEGDVELQFAEKAVLLPLGAGITPASPPTFVEPAAAEELLYAGTEFFEDVARESYTSEELNTPDSTFDYTISLSRSKPLAWVYAWCASDQETLDQNFEHIQLQFLYEGAAVSEEDLATLDLDSSGMKCRLIYAVLDEWAGGEHHLQTVVTFDAPINDGTDDYPAQTNTHNYTVYVKP